MDIQILMLFVFSSLVCQELHLAYGMPTANIGVIDGDNAHEAVGTNRNGSQNEQEQNMTTLSYSQDYNSTQTPSPIGSTTTEEPAKNIFPLVALGLAAGLLVAVIIAVAIICCIRRKKRLAKKASQKKKKSGRGSRKGSQKGSVKRSQRGSVKGSQAGSVKGSQASTKSSRSSTKSSIKSRDSNAPTNGVKKTSVKREKEPTQETEEKKLDSIE